jgi:hypothetical protein
MRRLPGTLALAHALVAMSAFGIALNSPERGGLAPIVAYWLDYPCSLLFERLRRGLHGDLGVTGRLLVDASIYVILGSIWFYAIGVALSRVQRRRI